MKEEVELLINIFKVSNNKSCIIEAPNTNQVIPYNHHFNDEVFITGADGIFGNNSPFAIAFLSDMFSNR